MNTNFEGFVIYNKNENKNKAFAVVSENYECKAESIKIPETFKKFIVPIEDKRFYNHRGIDFKGTTRALLRNVVNMKILEGGSTLSQQLARNLLKDNSKTLHRKVKETLKAIELEHYYSKDDILNLYFNNIYFGRNLRGIRTASLYYFDKETEKLNNSEILFLITILRGPNYYLSNVEITNKRMQMLSDLLLENQNINSNQHKKLIKRKINIENNKISLVRKSVVPFISEKIDVNKKTIISTLTQSHQKFAEKFIQDSKYPTSVVIIKNQKVVGFSSYYGSDYPFIFKSNVGSTLKPFIYYLERKEFIVRKNLILIRTICNGMLGRHLG
ncbi:transglycosylase domain-containing protein [Chryseobacterium gotjawalense]|uniref:peptidoglycan glycosyltransferase n=1 Tax=Chryseobacterium gotjawalense TaxID=3042315 RepID=A0ABY8RGU0_9FLAO|nr:transglycosylase domain-containing protein [Chryseobacterium sp. wdc7]WHF52237.1 transglycosylase domain-containing protein [Chryseobacterium sp. wdc7]